MREILFRGYNTALRKWFYGDLLHTDSINGQIVISNEESFVGVKSETVGQFTGMLDKNGKRIFEGDIITCWGERHIVEWVDGSCGFEPLSDSRENCGHCGGGLSPYCCEVIGNIHDNPELVEEMK